MAERSGAAASAATPTAAATPSPPAADLSTPYLRARAIEGRLYPDSFVVRLPLVPDGHPLAAEWRLRADSAARLAAYLGGLARRRDRPLVVLDGGCGNGWLANALAQIPGTDVVGIDLNLVELEQARLVFRAPNLRFLPGDVRAAPPSPPPDVAILASVIQYVPDLGALVRRLVPALAPGGELHVLDSPIYRASELPAARERTRAHYARIGVPDMADAYHHHSWDELAAVGLAVDVLYRPDALIHRLERRLLGIPRSPFPWLRIRALGPSVAGTPDGAHPA